MSEGTNPFEPPKADWAVDERDADGSEILVDASLGVRFANVFLDSIIRVFLGAALGVLLKGNVGVMIFFMLGYYIGFETMFGRTPAKWITRTRVVTTEGKRARFPQILGRTLCRYVPFEPFSFFGNTRGWHDRWSNTRVVRAT